VAKGPTTPLEQAAEAAGGRRRRTLVWAAAALVVGLVAGTAGGLLLSRADDRDTTTLTYGQGGDMPTVEINYGYCYQVAPGENRSIDSGAQRDCDEVHDSQVYGLVATYGQETQVDYPGTENLEELGEAACGMYFDSLVVGEDREELAVTVLVPSEQAFAEDSRSEGSSTPSFQTRDVYCVLTADDGRQLTGTRVLADG
jgi:hypothetical protein